MIYLTRSNYKELLPVNVLAISYYPQEPNVVHGPISFVTDDTNLFRIQAIDDGFSISELYELCPFLQTCSLRKGRLDVPEDWKSMDLEDGGYLMIKKTIYPRFIKKINSLLDPSDEKPDWYIFDKNWVAITLELLSK